MSIELDTLFTTARPAFDAPTRGAAEQLLRDPQTRLLSDEPSVERVDDLLPTLRVRAAHAQRAGKQVVGLAAVIDRLETLPRQSQVLGYSVDSPQAVARLYFAAGNHHRAALRAQAATHAQT